MRASDLFSNLPRPLRGSAPLLGAICLVALTGCGGSPTAPQRDDVFYLHGSGVIDKNQSYEAYFPPLNADESDRLPRRVGVGILDGDVRFARPIDWYVRDADYSDGARFISYQSPRQFLFSIFERVDHPEDSWPDVMKRYERDIEDQGGQILAARMPIATANAQARVYLVKTRVPAKPAYHSYAHEVIVRSGRRLLLVQVVHGENVEAVEDEMASAVRSMLVY
ncbi:hypothetical protein [Polyangium aurulentum]|uniref:hypothetical protein n=1 Tax=Polyangium aurulentum TaxID=2567896 RepID=UPI0010ADF7D7|nr:hypothetical protein [Polyangium aurulentum]UQA55628.1 hypothetical protein E8A73_030345 [Polyangium aurulentum]